MSPDSAIRAAVERAKTLSVHLGQPHVPLDIHALASQHEAGERILDRKRIYLDLRYWIYCRDAASGEPAKPAHETIWQLLESLAHREEICCPVCAPVFQETLRQPHERRMRTARVIDQLSAGIALQVSEVRALKEISHFTWVHLLGCGTLQPIEHYVWVPLGHLAGELVLTGTVFERREELAIQKKMYDVIGGSRMQEIMAVLRDLPPSEFPDDRNFQRRQTTLAALHRNEFDSYKEAFAVEVRGVADLWLGEILDFANDLFEKGNFISIFARPTDANELAINLMAILNSGLITERLGTQLPSLHIPAGIHAAIRHKRQHYTKGDLHDFEHATAALPYCDAFFTDRRLAALLTHPPLDYDQSYNCAVLCDDDDIVEYLRAM